jgi:hypothetical protein
MKILLQIVKHEDMAEIVAHVAVTWSRERPLALHGPWGPISVTNTKATPVMFLLLLPLSSPRLITDIRTHKILTHMSM